MATAVIINPPVVVQPPRTVRLTLSMEEAQDLINIMGKSSPVALQANMFHERAAELLKANQTHLAIYDALTAAGLSTTP